MKLPYPLQLHGLTDVGRARSNNEDAFALVPAAGLAVLADGMGGYNAGEVASQMLTSFLRDELGRWLAEADGAPPAAVQQAIRLARACVHRHAGADEIVADLQELHAQVLYRRVLGDGGELGDRDGFLPDGHGAGPLEVGA